MLMKLLRRIPCCIHCEFYDVLVYNRLHNGYCIQFEKITRNSDCCNSFKIRS